MRVGASDYFSSIKDTDTNFFGNWTLYNLNFDARADACTVKAQSDDVVTYLASALAALTMDEYTSGAGVITTCGWLFVAAIVAALQSAEASAWATSFVNCVISDTPHDTEPCHTPVDLP